MSALDSTVTILVERHLRRLVKTDTVRRLASSREALMRHYRTLGNDAAVHLLASAAEFSLQPGPDGSFVLTFAGGQVVWTRTQLMKTERSAASEVDELAIGLAGGLDRFLALTDDEREAMTAEAVAQTMRRLQRRRPAGS